MEPLMTPRTSQNLARKSFLLSLSLTCLAVFRFQVLQESQYIVHDNHHHNPTSHLASIQVSFVPIAVNNTTQPSTKSIVSSPCLQHMSQEVSHGRMAGSVPNQTLLQHATAATCGQLRRQWQRKYQHPSPSLLSEYAQQIRQHQSDCTLPVATHTMDNTFGLGSHLLLWGQAVCNAMEQGYRLQSYTTTPWIWWDQNHCKNKRTSTANGTATSPMACYFPLAEPQHCETTTTRPTEFTMPTSINVTDPRDKTKWCTRIQTASSPQEKELIRAASTEYLFHHSSGGGISPLVVQEAQRQVGVLFPDNNGIVPEDLVTVHIRWGDKFWEMELASIEEYIAAINTLLMRRRRRRRIGNASHPGVGNDDNDKNNTTTLVPTANIYLATEDPRAYQEFMKAKPKGWNVYADITLQEIDAFRPPKGNRASWAAKNTQGRSGLIALGSLLVAMEANLFVLTTKSNWSALMNHLRMQIINPLCGNCTDMIDLRPGGW